MLLFDQTEAAEGDGYAIFGNKFEVDSSKLSLISSDNTQPPPFIIYSALDVNSTPPDSSDNSSYGFRNGFENYV
jgi:hypothetical protein